MALPLQDESGFETEFVDQRYTSDDFPDPWLDPDAEAASVEPATMPEFKIGDRLLYYPPREFLGNELEPGDHGFDAIIRTRRWISTKTWRSHYDSGSEDFEDIPFNYSGWVYSITLLQFDGAGYELPAVLEECLQARELLEVASVIEAKNTAFHLANDAVRYLPIWDFYCGSGVPLLDRVALISLWEEAIAHDPVLMTKLPIAQFQLTPERVDLSMQALGKLGEIARYVAATSGVEVALHQKKSRLNYLYAS